MNSSYRISLTSCSEKLKIKHEIMGKWNNKYEKSEKSLCTKTSKNDSVK